jgi:ATP-dependent helicase HrpA
VGGGRSVEGFPALVDEGTAVALRVLGSRPEADRATHDGVRRLLALTLPSPLKGVVGRLDNPTKLALGHNPDGSVPALLADCVTAALDALMARHGELPGDDAGFARLQAAVRAELPDTTYGVVVAVARVLATAHDVSARVTGTAAPAVLPAWLDIRSQLARLVHPGFVTATGAARLRDLQRYLTAVQRRLDALTAPGRDAERMARVQAVEQEHAAWLAGLRPDRRSAPDVQAVRWMLEELRVSLFAQQLGTPAPISEKRIYRAMDAADG